MSTSTPIEQVRAAIRSQIDILTNLADSASPAIVDAAALIRTAHHVITSGVGKSAFIAQKLSASLTSIGCEARFVHPTDALHGDIGIIHPGSVLVIFSKSGSTEELVKLSQIDQLHDVVRIVVSANPLAPLHRPNDCLIVIPVTSEYDHNNLLPTASTTSSMAVADLLVASTASMLSTSGDVLRKTHPRGTIGKLLLTQVGDMLPSLPPAPQVYSTCLLNEAISVLQETARGIVCGVDEDGRLTGILTDGDVRRLVSNRKDLQDLTFEAVATTSPITVTANTTLHEAVRRMEERTSKIAVLPVVSDDGTLQGVIHLHDIVTYQFSVS